VDAVGIQCDLADPAATAAAMATVVDRWDRLDILVIPAGGAVTGQVLAVDGGATMR
jgi:NADP-dependent 3-hydroxy acid dehydrogenase YdfG